MTIRKAMASDAKRLFLLEQELFSVENYPLSLRAFYYHIRHNMLYVAQNKEGQFIGYALTLIRRRNAKLYSLGVAKAYRGSGVAKSLVEVTLSALTELGFERMILEVRTDNAQAIGLYHKLGFEISKKVSGFYRDGCDAFIMEVDNAKKAL